MSASTQTVSSGGRRYANPDLGDRPSQIRCQVEYIGTSQLNPWALEPPVDVYICRGAKFGTLAQIWPKLKHWR